MTNSHKHDVQEIYFYIYIYHVHVLKRNVVRDTSFYYKFLKNRCGNSFVISHIYISN
jgi:hypothetical protein